MPDLPPPTVVSIREEIRRLRDEWTGETDGQFKLLVPTMALERLSRKAGEVPGAPPPPPWPGSTDMPLRNRPDAITAANVLLAWCEQAEGPRHPEGPTYPATPAEPQVAAVEPRAALSPSRRIHVDGKVCQIAFDGENLTLTEQGGAIYLAELLMHPDSPDRPARYSPWALERLKGLPADRETMVGTEATGTATGQWNMTDPRTVKEIKGFIRESEEELAEAREAGNLKQIDDLNEAITKAENYLKETTYSGKPKVEGDDRAAQERVSGAFRRIRKTLCDMGATGGTVADYLKTYVICQNGQFFFAPPLGDTPWES